MESPSETESAVACQAVVAPVLAWSGQRPMMSAMADDEEEARPKSETAVLPRNFTLTVEERLRAIAGGPPAFALRRRRIEDLEAAIVRAIVTYAGKAGAPPEAGTLPFTIKRDIDRLNRLIDDHNRYYPIEARLRMDLRTGQLMDWGEPWIPTPPVSVETLLAAARAITARAGH